MAAQSSSSAGAQSSLLAIKKSFELKLSQMKSGKFNSARLTAEALKRYCDSIKVAIKSSSGARLKALEEIKKDFEHEISVMDITGESAVVVDGSYLEKILGSIKSALNTAESGPLGQKKPSGQWRYRPTTWTKFPGGKISSFLARHDNQPPGFLAKGIFAKMKPRQESTEIQHPIPSGTRVILAQHDNGTEVLPECDAVVDSCDDRQEAWGIQGPGGFSYVVTVEPQEEGDDGLREITGDQIKSLAVDSEPKGVDLKFVSGRAAESFADQAVARVQEEISELDRARNGFIKLTLRKAGLGEILDAPLDLSDIRVHLPYLKAVYAENGLGTVRPSGAASPQDARNDVIFVNPPAKNPEAITYFVRALGKLVYVNTEGYTEDTYARYAVSFTTAAANEIIGHGIQAEGLSTTDELYFIGQEVYDAVAEINGANSPDYPEDFGCLVNNQYENGDVVHITGFTSLDAEQQAFVKAVIAKHKLSEIDEDELMIPLK